MLKHIIRRLLALPVIMFVVSVVLFFLMLQLPLERRVQIYLPSGNPHATEEQKQQVMEQVIERRGLNDPLPVQYVRWVQGLLRGEWGYSPVWHQDVLAGIIQRAPASAEIALLAMIPCLLLAMGLGSAAARQRGRIPDHIIRTATAVAWAFPPFIMGLLFMNLFYAWLGWFPPERLSIWAGPIIEQESFRLYTRMYTIDALLNGNIPLFIDALRHLGLPALTLGVSQWALMTRIMRASMLDVLDEDYITTARSKGLPEYQIARVHARRNAILPLISTGSVTVSTLITTLVIVEMIFNFNGLGRSATAAIMNSDILVAVGFTLFTCFVVVLASLAADLLYAFIDPRIRL